VNIKVEEKKGSPTRAYQTNNEKIFKKVLNRYVSVGSQALFCASNSIYKTRNIVRSTKGTEYLCDVEKATRRVLSPTLWDKWCNIALQTAGRPHNPVSAEDYAQVVELAGTAYTQAELEPHMYFRFVRQRTA
jgi:hypothetical protein